jgi:dTDP-4-dehydrorhamnose reductase
MRILLLGKNGQLGWELRRTLAPLGEVVALDYPEIDLIRPDTTCRLIREIRPEIVINAAAYTLVDQAEEELEIATAINASAPGKLAEAASDAGAAFVHFSTDYVFDGSKGSAYTETDSPNPLNVYGKSKLSGEQAVAQIDGAYLIFRTSWVYSMRRDSFVTKILDWARQKRSLRVVIDQVGNPTWARALAEITGLVIARTGGDHIGWINQVRGIYHLAGDGFTTRYDWARSILSYDPHKAEQVVAEITPARTEEFPTPARRPPNSSLDCSLFKKRFDLQLPPWEEALKLALEG